VRNGGKRLNGGRNQGESFASVDEHEAYRVVNDPLDGDQYPEARHLDV
jgi:hypothetical protein